MDTFKATRCQGLQRSAAVTVTETFFRADECSVGCHGHFIEFKSVTSHLDTGSSNHEVSAVLVSLKGLSFFLKPYSACELHGLHNMSLNHSSAQPLAMLSVPLLLLIFIFMISARPGQKYVPEYLFIGRFSIIWGHSGQYKECLKL